MRNFDYSHLKDRTWDNEILSYIAKIHEFKGKQELYFRQKPVELERLVEIAKVQSTESSNRIEGIVTTRSRLQQLVEDKTPPRNRDEKEILGYRNVLSLIHETSQNKAGKHAFPFKCRCSVFFSHLYAAGILRLSF